MQISLALTLALISQKHPSREPTLEDFKNSEWLRKTSNTPSFNGPSDDTPSSSFTKNHSKASILKKAPALKAEPPTIAMNLNNDSNNLDDDKRALRFKMEAMEEYVLSLSTNISQSRNSIQEEKVKSCSDEKEKKDTGKSHLMSSSSFPAQPRMKVNNRSLNCEKTIKSEAINLNSSIPSSGTSMNIMEPLSGSPSRPYDLEKRKLEAGIAKGLTASKRYHIFCPRNKRLYLANFLYSKLRLSLHYLQLFPVQQT